MSPTPAIVNTSDRTRWTNFHRNFTIKLRRLVDVWNGDPSRSTIPNYNASTAALQQLIADSLAKSESIRGLGGTWSLSRAAVSEGTLVNTKPMNYKFRVASSAVSSSFTGNPDNLYFVQCGNSVAELNWYMFDEGRSLPTSGASNGQTIAGAVSTGTHGSAIDVGSVADYVVAIHLVVSPTRHVWLERDSNPVVRDSRLPDPLGAEVIRDDAIFNACLVSFGSFGLIHGLVLEVSDKYFLNVFRKKMPFDSKMRDTLEDLDFSRLDLPRPGDRPYHFQLVINPSEPDGDVFVTTMYRDATKRAGSKLPDPPSSLTQGDNALAVAGFLTDVFHDLGPVLSKGLLAAGYGEKDNISGTPGQIFRDTGLSGRASSTAVGVPLTSVNDTLDAIFEVQRQKKAPVLLGLRYVKATRATLGFTYHTPRTAVVEMDGPRSSNVRATNQSAWGLLRSRDIPFTFHWGKQHDLTHNMVRKAYGDARVDSWLAARRKLLDTAALRRAFSNDMVERAGLDQ